MSLLALFQTRYLTKRQEEHQKLCSIKWQTPCCESWC